MMVLPYIHERLTRGQHLLVVLIDPEQPVRFAAGQLDMADLIFIGGSTGRLSPCFIERIRAITQRPLVLFPGNPSQLVDSADALLFLSVLSSRNADVLIGQQVQAAARVQQSGIEVIPMGYILIDGGTTSSVQQASHSLPISQSDVELITSTAIAGQLLGHQLIYLEAGSGAKHPVSIDIIRQVRQSISLPLIVGGGITSPQAMHAAFDAGADMVVIGNFFEQHPEQLPLFSR